MAGMTPTVNLLLVSIIINELDTMHSVSGLKEAITNLSVMLTHDKIQQTATMQQALLFFYTLP